MPLTRRHKWLLTALFIYWPALFVATHLPIHDLGRRTGMSDKTMHVLAYLGLSFLAWLAVSPKEKVNWLKARVWIILALILVYGVVDEALQMLVGRSADAKDLAANMIGALLGMAILSVMTFWPAALAISAIFTFAIANMARIDQIAEMPFLNVTFHFIAYAGFTLVWVQYLQKRLLSETSPATWVAVALSLPAALLLAVKSSSPLFGRPVGTVDCITALSAIMFAAVVSRFVCKTIWLPAAD